MQTNTVEVGTQLYACVDPNGYVYVGSISDREFGAQMFLSGLVNTQEITIEEMKQHRISKIDTNWSIVE